jgi:hypothetical protein
VLTDEGELSRQVNIVIDGRNIRYLAAGIATPLNSEQEIAFFPALAGGSRVRRGLTPVLAEATTTNRYSDLFKNDPVFAKIPLRISLTEDQGDG